MKLVLTMLAILIPAAASAQTQTGPTCTERQGACNRLIGQYGAEWGPKCKRAGDDCRRTGRFVGPYTGQVWDNVPRR